MSDLPEGIDSTFRYILIAAKRAEQLIHGARARVATRHVKPTTVALAELAAADVPWQRPIGVAKDHLPLKRDHVRSPRDEIAAVAADSEEIAC